MRGAETQEQMSYAFLALFRALFLPQQPELQPWQSFLG